MTNRLAQLASISLLSLVLGLPGVAGADDPPLQPELTPTPTGAYPKEFVLRPNTLHEGMFEVRLDFIANLSKELAFKPFVLAPDLAYGINDKLQVALQHASSLCLAGKSKGCPMVYQDTTLDVLWNFIRDEKQDFNVHGGIDVGYLKNTADETKILMAIRAGVLGSILLTDKLAFYFDPSVSVGVTERDLGNKESFVIPLRLAFQATPELTPILDLSFGGPFKDFGDNSALGFGIGVNYAISNMFDVGAEFAVVDVLLNDAESDAGVGAFDQRALDVWVAYRFGGHQ